MKKAAVKSGFFLCVPGMYVSYRVEVPGTLYCKEY